jgi:hypothetical protein
MMKKVSKSFRMIRSNFLMQVIFCFLLAGCAPLVLIGGAGVSGYKYYMGEMTVIFQADFMKTWDGTMTALKEMSLAVESKAHSLTKGTILARREDKKPVRIAINYRSSQETEVTIRIGRFGDKNASATITERIRSVLFGE